MPFFFKAITNQISDGTYFDIVFFEKLSKSGRLAILPSSLRISTIVAAASNPANLPNHSQFSMSALVKTPPGWDIMGNI